jgi:hypothetical protein
MRIEKLKEREQVPCSKWEAAIGLLGIFGAVYLFGLAVDRWGGGVEKEKEARENGYDV